jgi:uncharacterized metal-binding protein
MLGMAILSLEDMEMYSVCCLISDFSRDVNEIFALLGHYTA